MSQIALPMSRKIAVTVTTLSRNPRFRGFSMTRSVTTLAQHVTILAAVVTILAACQSTKSSHCTAFEAVRPSQAQIDVMTDEEVERTLIELEKFRRICGWKQ